MPRHLFKKLVTLAVVASALVPAVSFSAAQAAGPAPLNMDTLTVGIANNKPWGYRDTDGRSKASTSTFCARSSQVWV